MRFYQRANIHTFIASRKFLHILFRRAIFVVMNLRKSLYLIFAAVLWWIMYSCASIGNPEGGPQDKTPPIFVRSNPKPAELNVNDKKIELYFDEIVTLKDPSTKIVVSPAQTEMPKLSANGKKVTVELVDSMLPNTTYTVDFSNSIQDNNEGNPLEDFAFSFSTGSVIDSLRVGGIVLDSHSLEPMQGVIVGLHSNLSDTAFHKLKLERIARTNDLGQFIIQNIKPGKYRLFAINDVDRDYKFANPSEDIAFLDSIVIPTSKREEASDTVYALDGKTVDTVKAVKKTRFYPDDILLNMFNENYKAQYLNKNNRIDSTRIYIEFAAPSDTLPALRIINKEPEPKDWYSLERSKTNDTLTYWIKRPELVSSDTLRVEMRSLRTDTVQNLVWGVDTLNFTFQRPKPKKKKKKEDEEADSLANIRFLDLKIVGMTTQEVYAPLILEAGEQIVSIDTAAIHFDIKNDTLWNEVKNFKIAMRDTLLNHRQFVLRHKWTPGATYRLRIDSLGIKSIYGLAIKPFEANVTVRKLEDYGNLIFSIPEVRDSAFVELLNATDKPVLIAPVKNNRAELINLLPGKYYARIVIDRNGNGKYDTGNYDLKLQPEETYYYPSAINIKKNWDIEQTWNIYAQPIDRQKPDDIKKNKPEKKKWEEEAEKQNPNQDENEEGFNDFTDPNDPNQRFFNQQDYYNNYNR